MKKFLPVILTISLGLVTIVSCNKGDDNPYGDWKCICFVTKAMKQDTTIVFEKDTTVLYAKEMDKNSATAFCETTKQGFVDTLGSAAVCNLK